MAEINDKKQETAVAEVKKESPVSVSQTKRVNAAHQLLQTLNDIKSDLKKIKLENETLRTQQAEKEQGNVFEDAAKLMAAQVPVQQNIQSETFQDIQERQRYKVYKNLIKMDEAMTGKDGQNAGMFLIIARTLCRYMQKPLRTFSTGSQSDHTPNWTARTKTRK